MSESMAKEISQRAALHGGFGDVLRSSAIFYVRQTPAFQTTLSFMNYWREKRGLQVAIIASLRTMEGRLLRRDRLHFAKGMVINYVPRLGGETFEGTVEIEVFAADNLAIPYPAIMALYQSTRSFCQVHSYARAYSRHEVEEGRTLCRGAEANWTLRDSTDVSSFCIFHNGPRLQPAQRAELEVRTLSGATKTVNVELDAILPYGSVRVVPSEHLSDLADFLRGEPGHARLCFDVNEGFTRMLVGNETTDGGDFQATHSDFDFGVQRTDHLLPGLKGYLRVPAPNGLARWVVVYPSQDRGRYRLSLGSAKEEFSHDNLFFLRPDEKDEHLLFEKVDGAFPTRLNVGIGYSRNSDVLPTEPSLGVVHRGIPPKRLHWLPVCFTERLNTHLIIHDQGAVFGDFPNDGRIHFRLYSAQQMECLVAQLGCSNLSSLVQGIPLETIFPDAQAYLAGESGYLTVYSDYVGLKVYSLIGDRRSGSVSFEHSF